MHFVKTKLVAAVLLLASLVTSVSSYGANESRAAGAVTAVFWSDLTQNKIMKTTTGATPTVSSVLTAASTPAISSPRPMATDGTYLFIGNTNGNDVVRWKLDGTETTTLSNMANLALSGFYANANSLFYTRWSNGVYRAAKDGSGAVQLVTPSANGAPSGEFAGVYATADTVYFTYYGSGGGISGKVYKRSIDTTGGIGSVSLVYDSATDFGTGASKRTYEGIWIADSKIYLATGAGIHVVTTAGVNVETFAVGSAKNLTVADGYVYFTTAGTAVKRWSIASASVETLDNSGGFTFGVAAAPAFTVTYYGNGSTSGTVPTAVDYQTGATVTVSGNSGSLAQQNCTFNGWNTLAAGNGTSRVAASTFAMDSVNVDLYAQWSCSFPVTYVGNGNTGGSVPVDGATYPSNATVTVLGNTGGLTKSGYQFKGWEVTAGSSTQFPNIGGTVAITSALTFTARWGGGPLEFAATPTGPALTTLEFPDALPLGQSTLTVYVRNMGNDPVTVSNVSGSTGTVSQSSGTTCSTSGGNIQPYANNTANVCRYEFLWNAPGAGSTSYVFGVQYFVTNSITLTGTPKLAALNPVFDTPVPTATGYTVNITNWNASYAWVPTVSVGSGTATVGTAVGSLMPITVTGVSSGASSSVQVLTTRVGYFGGTATVSGTALVAATTTTTLAPTTTTVATTTTTTLAPTTTTVATTIPKSSNASTPSTVTAPESKSSQLPVSGGGSKPYASACWFLLAGALMIFSRRRLYWD